MYNPRTGNARKKSAIHRDAQLIARNVQNIQRRTESMKRLLKDLDKSPDDDDLFEQLQQIQHATTKLAQDTNRNIKHVNDFYPEESYPCLHSPQEQTQLQSEKSSLIKDYKNALDDLSMVQRCASRRRKRVMKQPRILEVTDVATPESIRRPSEVAIDNQQVRMIGAKQLSFDDEEHSVHVMHERERTFRQLEKDMEDLNDILQSLEAMAQESAPIVNEIVEVVTEAKANIENGENELKKAEKYKMKTRTKKLFLCLALIVLIIITIVIIVLWQFAWI